MLLGTRKALRRTARGLLAVMAGAWLFAAVAPCVMAQPAPAAGSHAGCCTDKAVPLAENCDALSALDCRTPEPVPPSAAFDQPAPAVALLYTVPAALTPSFAGPARPSLRADTSPPPPHLNRKHTRLLI